MTKDQAEEKADEIMRGFAIGDPMGFKQRLTAALLEASACVEVSEEELKDKGEIFASWWVRVGEKENYHYSQAVSVWSAACEAVHAGYRRRDEIKRRGSEG